MMKCSSKAFSLLNSQTKFKFNLQHYIPLLKTIVKDNFFTQGTVLHGHFIKMGVASERYVSIKLLIMYLNNKKHSEANEIVKEFSGFDVIVHNCLISANVESGNIDKARELFDQMPARNEVSWTALISGLVKCGRVEESMRYFERNPFQNVVSWTAMISGLVQNGMSFRGLEFFLGLLHSGVMPNDVTFTSVLRACVSVGEFGLGMSVLALIVKMGFEEYLSISNSLITLSLRMGKIDLAKEVFGRMEKRDIVSWTAILDVYVEMGNLNEARRIFDEMPERNEVSWSAMIARYSQSGHAEEALKLFCDMVEEGFKPNISCFSSVLSLLANLGSMQAGMNIHGHVTKIGMAGTVFIGSSLIDLYCKCGRTHDGYLVFNSIPEKNVVVWNSMVSGYSFNGQLERAREVFQQIPAKNSISWNAMISGCAEHQHFDEALEIFQEMLGSGNMPTTSTFSSVLCACAGTASMEKGKNLHGKMLKQGIMYDVFLGTALADMYAKCGDIDSCKKVFNRMPEKNDITWTVMLQGLAENGFVEESLTFFEEMEKTSSIPPNDLMFVAVLFACAHCGLIEKGLQYFKSMEKDYGVRPNGRHYTCVVDMLSRSGRLLEAEQFLNTMPVQPESNAWAALLSGCHTYKNEEIAERTARKLSESAETSPAGYILLSNIYAYAGKWIDVSQIRKLMREQGLKKTGGCSWLELRGQIHSFYSEDGNHSRAEEIYKTLKLLQSDLRIHNNQV